MNPESNPPTVFPKTAGKRCDPAVVFDAFCVTRKYRGTENIIATCAEVCNAMIAYGVATSLFIARRGGKIGSNA